MSLSNTPLFLKVARRYTRVGSTNAEAVAAISNGEHPAPGSVFWADAQSAGRGQGANRWHGTPGDNLALSLILYPDHLAVADLFVLTQVASLAVAETVASCLPASLSSAVRVKWPNDVYVGERKIAGILVQNGLRGSRIGWSVIGIGLNVNERRFPEELLSTATSLRQLSGAVLDREKVADRLFTTFPGLYEMSGTGCRAALNDRYHRALFRLDERATYREVATGITFSATLRGVDRQGRLLLEDARGRQQAYALREVRFLIN